MKNETSAEERKRQRIIKKIYDLIKDKKAVFLTMSFNDETLKKTNAETRRRYIKNYLKNETALYILNIDYGAKKGREHYHAIVKANTLKKEDFYNYRELEPIKDKVNLRAYKYGNIQADFIGKKYNFNNDKAIKETAKKLYKHAIKESTKNNKIIYSRKEPSKAQQIKRLSRLWSITTNNYKKEIDYILEDELNEQKYINVYNQYFSKYNKRR